MALNTVPIEFPSLPPTGHQINRSQGQTSSIYGSQLNATPQSALSLIISQIASQLGQQVYGWAQNSIAPNTALTNDVVSKYMNGAGLATSGANTSANLYNNTYVPELQQLAGEAGSYGSAARAQLNAGEAAANSVQGTQAGINNTLSQLESYGVNPSSGSFPAQIGAMRVAQGAAAAGAGTQASLGTQAAGRQLQAQSASLGLQQPGIEANFLNQGAANLSGAANTQFGNTATQSGAFATVPPYFQQAQNMFGEQATNFGNTNSTNSSYGTNYTQQGTSQWEPNWNPNPGPVGSKGPGAATTYTGAASGGAIPDGSWTQGGHVDPGMSPSQGAITDDVNAHVNAYEFVIPKDVALWEGQKNLQKMIMKARSEMQSPGLAKPTVGPPGGASFNSQGADQEAIPTGGGPSHDDTAQPGSMARGGPVQPHRGAIPWQ